MANHFEDRLEHTRNYLKIMRALLSGPADSHLVMLENPAKLGEHLWAKIQIPTSAKMVKVSVYREIPQEDTPAIATMNLYLSYNHLWASALTDKGRPERLSISLPHTEEPS